MKAIIAYTASLVIGLVIGCWLGYRYYDRHVTNEAVQQMVQYMESSDAAEAARDVRAVESIASGDTQRAVHLLSHPIADYYTQYAEDGRNEQRSKVRALIEELAKTNHEVAARIAEMERDSHYRARGHDSMAQPEGGANGSQPIHSETNSTSGEAGSRRSP